MKIIAASIVQNEEKHIEGMIRSVSWVDEIVIYNDYCSDKTIEKLDKLSQKQGLPKIHIINPLGEKTMLSFLKDGTRDLSNEIHIRNLFLKTVFNKYNPSVVVLIDGDELISSNLLSYIKRVLSNEEYDSIALTCNHIYDESCYLNIYPAIWNNVKMVDPHIRVLKNFQQYQQGKYPRVPDCFLKPTKKTLCLDLPIHYHLKYIKYFGNTNHSLRFLTKDVKKFGRTDYVKPNRFGFPVDLKLLIYDTLFKL